MNMYIALSRSGRFEIVENLGVIDPKEERTVPRATAPNELTA